MKLLLLFAVAVALLCRILSFDYLCDDAFIYFRYAKNFWESGELVFNRGEFVEGFSGPLWMSILSNGKFLNYYALKNTSK